jgi:hypothetical protein
MSNPPPPPYLFPRDNAFLKPSDKADGVRSFEDYEAIDFKAKPNRLRLHVNAVPVPYTGDLAKADIFILMKNPGLSPSDYNSDKNRRKKRFRNLRQKLRSHDCPFTSDQQSKKRTGYWQKKFSKLIQAIVEEQHENDEEEAWRYFAGHVACLNLLPYHSKDCPKLSRLQELPSVKAMKAYVHDAKLFERAKRDKALIVVVRGKKHWQEFLGEDLERRHKNIVVYASHNARRASFDPQNSEGGKAILKYLARHR